LRGFVHSSSTDVTAIGGPSITSGYNDNLLIHFACYTIRYSDNDGNIKTNKQIQVERTDHKSMRIDIDHCVYTDWNCEIVKKTPMTTRSEQLSAIPAFSRSSHTILRAYAIRLSGHPNSELWIILYRLETSNAVL